MKKKSVFMTILDIEKSSKDFKETHTVEVSNNDDSIIPAWFKKWSDEVYQKKPPQWFKRWNEEVYQKEPPQWFKKWNEEVYQKVPPQWFAIWHETEFKPLVEKFNRVIKLNNLRTE